MTADINRIKEILELLEKTPFNEIEWEEADFKIKVKKKLPDEKYPQPEIALYREHKEPAKIHAVDQDKDKYETEIELTEGRAIIRSPLVGTFYRSPSPNANPFVNEGDIIKPGQVLCVIEAMKLLNEVECDCTGKIVAILVNNAQPVEYGEPLFVIQTENYE